MPDDTILSLGPASAFSGGEVVPITQAGVTLKAKVGVLGGFATYDQLVAVVGGLIPQGSWNADTNSPDITTTTETGYYWIVSVDGATNLGGITDWKIDDYAIKTATGWAKADHSPPVSSVFTRIGAIAAAASDYDASQVDNDSVVTGAFVKDALDTLDSGKAAAAHTHTLIEVIDSGTAAALDVGTGANEVVQLNGSAKLPVVSGINLTALPGQSNGIIGSVQLSAGSGGFLSDPANLFWDNSAKRLGIGTNVPNTAFEVFYPGNWGQFRVRGGNAVSIEFYGGATQRTWGLHTNKVIANDFNIAYSDADDAFANVILLHFTVDGNIGFRNSGAGFGAGSGVFAFGNAIIVPTANPTAGGVMYAEAGALKWRGSSGTITTIAAS